MGVYTEGSIIIETKSEETAERLAESINNIEEFIKRSGKDPFHTSILDVHEDGTCVNVSLCSDRYPNAMGQCELILELVKTDFKGEVSSFSADLTAPENVIYEDFED